MVWQQWVLLAMSIIRTMVKIKEVVDDPLRKIIPGEVLPKKSPEVFAILIVQGAMIALLVTI